VRVRKKLKAPTHLTNSPPAEGCHAVTGWVIFNSFLKKRQKQINYTYPYKEGNLKAPILLQKQKILVFIFYYCITKIIFEISLLFVFLPKSIRVRI